MDNLIKTGQVALYLGTSPQTIRNYDLKGLLIPCLITRAGTRFYSEQTVKSFRNERFKAYENKKDY